MNARLEEALDAIGAAQRLDDLRALLRALREGYRLAHIAYHTVRIPGCAAEHPLLLVTYEADWVERYVRKDYFAIDPVVDHGMAGFLPLDWAAIDRSRPATRHLFADAARYGVGKQGVTLPLRGAGGERALFTITSNEPARKWCRQKLACLGELQMLVPYLHDRALGLSGLRRREPLCGLSPREAQCLQRLASGRAPKRIAHDLGISISAVRLYLCSAKRKLGCGSLHQAIAVAITRELIAA